MTASRAVPECRYPPRTMIGMRVFKYHALGNSYLIVDPRDLRPDNLLDIVQTQCYGVEEEAVLSPWFIWGLGKETWGIGSNGLLFGPFTGPNGGMEFQIYNTDGSRAEVSGNGLRIFAKFVFDAGYLSYGETLQFPLTVATPVEADGVSHVHRKRNDVTVIDPTVPLFAVDIGKPRFGPQEVLALACTESTSDQTRRGTVPGLVDVGRRCGMEWSDSTFVSIGNPHCVTFVEDPAHFPDGRSSEALKTIAYRSPEGDGRTFAEGCNLQWVYVRDRTIIDLRIFERGEGRTEASGSSASAATAAAFHRGLIGRLVEVRMPGGVLEVELRGVGQTIESVVIRGSATRIMEAQIDLQDFGCAAKERYTKA